MLACHPRISLLYLLHSDSASKEIETTQERISGWLEENFVDTETRLSVEAAESRLESILNAAEKESLIMMTTGQHHGLKRFFFGSLANTVAQSCDQPLFIIYRPESSDAVEQLS